MAEPTWEDSQPIASHQPMPSQPGDAPTWDNTIDMEEKYGGVSGTLKAGAAGLLRGATVGLSDPFLVKSGLVKKETLKGLEETNPEASIGSELVGTIAPAFFGEDAGVANIPGLISKVGRGVERGAAEILPEATSTLGRMATRGAATGAGLGTEGAIYGLGQSISENALGDHDLVSEKTLANIGMSAALTGGFGTLAGSVLGAFGKDLSKAEDKIAAQRASEAFDPMSAEGAMLQSSGIPAKEKLSLMDGIQKQKANAKEIAEAAGEIGAPLLPGQTSDSKLVQDAASHLMKGPPTIPGVLAQQELKKGFDAVENVIKETFGSGEHLTPYDGGKLIKDMLKGSIDKIYEPIENIYSSIKSTGSAIDLPDKARLTMYDKLVSLSQKVGSRGGPIEKEVRNIAERFLSQNKVEELDLLLNELGGEASSAFSSRNATLGHAISNASEAIKEFRFGQIAAQGKGLEKAGVEGAEQLARESIDEYKKANKLYRDFKETLGDLLSDQRLGGAKKATYGSVNDILENLVNEKVVDKLFDPKNADGLLRFKEKFPDVFAELIKQKKSQLFQSSMDGEKLGIRKVLKNIYDENKMSSKVRDTIFSTDEIKKLKAAKTWTDALPKDINPSGTNLADAFSEFYKNPISAITGNFSNLISKQLIERFASTPAEAAKAMTLVNTEREAMKTSQRITKGVANIFGQAKSTLPAKAFSKISTPEDYKEKTKEIKAIANNMNLFSDLMAKNTSGVSNHAPNIAQSMQGGMIRGIQFLNNKIPQTPVGLFEKEQDPSNYEVANFKRYYDIVQDPVSSLNQIKDGTLIDETLETLTNVFPKLYETMKQEVLDQITSLKEPQSVPYNIRQSVSQFLGQPLDQALSPEAIMANQAAFVEGNNKQQAENQTQKPSKPGMSKITLAKRSGLNRGEMEA